MKSIPAKSIIDDKSIVELDRILVNGFGNTQVMKFLGEFNEFLETTDLTVIGSDFVKFDQIANSFYYRNLIDQAFNGRKKIEIVKSSNYNPNDQKSSLKGYLMNIAIGETFETLIDTSNNWLKIKKLPEEWVRFSNNKNNTILIGGKSSLFKSWEEFGLKLFPIDSAVIIDPYLFQEKDEMLLNIPRIINGLKDQKLNNRALSILFIVGGDVNKRFRPEEFIKKRTNELSLIIKENFNESSINISIAFVKGQYIHDRLIFTNFYYIDAGRGFNFFNKSGSINSQKPNKVSLRFLSGPEIYEEFKNAVESYCNVLFNSNAILNLEGDWKSNKIINLIQG